MSDASSKPWTYQKVATAVGINDLANDVKRNQSAWYIYVAAFSANLLLITAGCFLAWGSPVIPKLLSNDTDVNPVGAPVTNLQVSVIASAPHLATMTSYLFMAKLTDSIGRKLTMMFSAISIVFALNCIAFAKNIYVYYVFLIIAGINLSGIYLTVPVYNAEISDNENRARLGSFVGLGIPFGMLVTYTVGSISSFKVLNLVGMLPALIHILLTPFFVVESPVYLASKGKREEALKALQWLQRNKSDEEIETEYLAIMDNIQMKNKIKKGGIFDLFKTHVSRKALFLSLVLCVSQQSAGLPIITSFIGIIFSSARSSLSAGAISVIVGSLQLLFFIIAGFTINKFDRKYLMLFSSLMCSLSLFLLGFTFYLQHINTSILKSIQFLPGVAIMVFIACFSLGYGPVPIALCSELFPNDLRSVGFAFSMVGECMFAFLLKFSFPLLSKLIGVYSCLFGYGIAGIINFLIFFFLLPKTKGKTLNEIQKILSK